MLISCVNVCDACAASLQRVYLQQFVYLLPRAANESVLFGNTLFNVRENEESGIAALPGDQSPVAEFTHQGLDGFHVRFALLDAARDVLATAKDEQQLQLIIVFPASCCVLFFKCLLRS